MPHRVRANTRLIIDISKKFLLSGGNPVKVGKKRYDFSEFLRLIGKTKELADENQLVLSGLNKLYIKYKPKIEALRQN